MPGQWKQIGTVGVDSGTLMIGDPCYLDDEGDWNPELYKEWICGGLCKNETQAVQIQELCMNQAVAFSSGFGDGVYPVFARIKNYGTKDRPDRRISQVKVVLIEDTETIEMLKELEELVGNPKDGEIIWKAIAKMLKRLHFEMSDGGELSEDEDRAFCRVIDIVEDEEFHCHIHK